MQKIASVDEPLHNFEKDRKVCCYYDSWNSRASRRHQNCGKNCGCRNESSRSGNGSGIQRDDVNPNKHYVKGNLDYEGRIRDCRKKNNREAYDPDRYRDANGPTHELRPSNNRKHDSEEHQRNILNSSTINESLWNL